MDSWSLKAKIVTMGGVLTTALIGVLFVLYYSQSKESSVQASVEKARAITLTAESSRIGMEKKRAQGIFSQPMLRKFATKNENDKLLGAIPVVAAWETAQLQADKGGYKFKVPKASPRNQNNKPNAIELEALKRFKADRNLKEYYVLDEEEDTVRYFRSVVLSETCMYCHGDPGTFKETAGMIEESVKNSQNGVNLAAEVAKLLDEITGNSRKVNDLVGEISAATAEQSQGIDQVNKAISEMDKVTQQNAGAPMSLPQAAAPATSEPAPLPHGFPSADAVSVISFDEEQTTNDTDFSTFSG